MKPQPRVLFISPWPSFWEGAVGVGWTVAGQSEERVHTLMMSAPRPAREGNLGGSEYNTPHEPD